MPAAEALHMQAERTIGRLRRLVEADDPPSAGLRGLGHDVVRVTALLPATAEAQRPGHLSLGGMDLRLYRPAMDSKGYLSVNGTDILGANDVSFGLVIDYGRNLLRVADLGQDDAQPPRARAFAQPQQHR